MTCSPASCIHATAVQISCGERSAGVLLLGPSGSGKSSLALQLMDASSLCLTTREAIHCQLVSDDQVQLHCEADDLFASAPETITGMLEVRGLGVMRTQSVANGVQVMFAVEHSPSEEIERLPGVTTFQHDSAQVPRHLIDFKTPDCAARVRLLVQLHWGLISPVE